MLPGALIALVATGAGPAVVELETPAGARDFGAVIAAAGDVDGDGIGDLLVGMPRYSGTEPEEGWVGLYLGKQTGFTTTPAWSTVGGQAGAHLGAAVASVDFDADGLSDIVVGAPGYSRGADGEGIVYVWLGSEDTTLSPTPFSVEGEDAGAQLGAALATGDFDGDGYGDMVIGLPGFANGRGRVGLYPGGDGGPNPFATWSVEGDNGDALGRSLARAWDVDGDGSSDVWIGDAHGVGLFLGDPLNLSHIPISRHADGIASLGDLDASGAMVIDEGYLPAGDVNGDGYADAMAIDRTEGRIAVYPGTPDGLGATPIRAGDCDCGDGARVLVAAGDVDGDGMGDIAVGAPESDKIEIWRGRSSGLSATADWTIDDFYSVGAAGDVNGDGFRDLLVGSIHRVNGDIADAGEVRIYRGAATGFVEPAEVVMIGDQIDTRLGHQMTGAGDVDGDGYADVLVPREHFDGPMGIDAGRVTLHWGSPGGLLGPGSHRPPWTLDGWSYASPFDRLGFSVSAAGDVDGDGLADFLVGSYGYLARGFGMLFLGDHDAPRLAWEGSGANAQRRADVFAVGDLDGDGYSDFALDASSAAGRYVGVLVRGADDMTAATPIPTENLDIERSNLHVGAGDVDGDGLADLFATDRFVDGRAGRAMLYRGDATTFVGEKSWDVLADQAASGFGRFATRAGDLDADGYGDVMVHADAYSTDVRQVGRVSVYFGAPEGLPTTADWDLVGTAPSQDLGDSLAALGDVDGDGFADLAFGPYEGMPATSGPPRVQVFFGNHGLGFAPTGHPNLRIAGLRDFAPIQPYTVSDVPFGVYLRGDARSAFGVQRVALEIEVKPSNKPFDGRDTQRSEYASLASAPSPMFLPALGLEPDTAYHWRARLRYDPAQSPVQGWTHWTWGGEPGQPSAVHFRTNTNHAPKVEDEEFLGVDALHGVFRNAPGLLALATDVDVRDTLTASVVEGARSGELVLSPDGTFFYRPLVGFAGIDSFRWRATDPHGASDIGTVSIHVEPGGACKSTSLAQCGRGRANATLQTELGPRGIRCWREKPVAGVSALHCDTDASGNIALYPPACEGSP